MPKQNDIALSFNDSVLYYGDVQLIRNNCWLNDHCILFWFQYMEHYLFVDYKSEFCFLQPAAAFMLQYLPVEDLLADSSQNNVFNNLVHKKLVFIPIVGNAHVDQGGGSHWSLLVYNNGTLCHIDSAYGYNHGAAAETAWKLGELLLRKGVANVSMVTFPLAPQQNNSFDCGVFVLANAEFIAKAYAASQRFQIPETTEHVEMKRQEMLQVIDMLSLK